MVAAIGAAVLLIGLLLIFGPYVESYVGDLLGLDGVFGWLWWTVQWPLLFLGLLAAFGVLHYFGPDVEHRRWQLDHSGVGRRSRRLAGRFQRLSPSIRASSARTTRPGARSRRSS